MMKLTEAALLIIIFLLTGLLAYTIAVVASEHINEVLEQFNIRTRDAWFEEGGHLYEK